VGSGGRALTKTKHSLHKKPQKLIHKKSAFKKGHRAKPSPSQFKGLQVPFPHGRYIKQQHPQSKCNEIIIKILFL